MNLVEWKNENFTFRVKLNKNAILLEKEDENGGPVNSRTNI